MKLIKLKKTITVIVLILASINLNGQKIKDFSYIDKIMLEIPDSLTFSTDKIAKYINSKFSTQNEKIRAVFILIAENIHYDYVNMYSFYLNHDTKKDINQILISRKGICTDYTNLYSEIANNVGVKTYIIKGYTKKKKQINYNPHSWCACKIDSGFYMIDPTWGSGHIENEQYIKEVNNNYFLKDPKRFIKTHIPFDPLWQFMNYPLTKKEFKEGKSKSDNREYFNYNDTLKIYEKQSKLEKLIAANKRIEKNKVTNYIVFNHLYNSKITIGTLLYNKAVNYYNEGVYKLNDYFEYQNNHYIPYKSDKEIKQMLNTIESKFIVSLKQFNEIKHCSGIINNQITHMKKMISFSIDELNEIKDNLEKYLKISKKYRESLARKTSNQN